MNVFIFCFNYFPLIGVSHVVINDNFMNHALSNSFCSIITEGRSAYYINISMNGFEKSEISVSVKNTTLLVSAEKKGKKKQDTQYFENTLSIPEDADYEKIDSNFEDDILKIKIMKNPKLKDIKKIVVK